MAISSFDIPETDYLFTQFEDMHWSAQKLTAHSNELGLTRISIEMHTNLAGWSTLKKQKLFGYTPEICGPVFGGGFNPVKPFYITVDLHTHSLTLLGILYDGENLKEWFQHEKTQYELANTDNFLLISTMQPITPNTQWGMSTKYSTSHHQ